MKKTKEIPASGSKAVMYILSAVSLLLAAALAFVLFFGFEGFKALLSKNEPEPDPALLCCGDYSFRIEETEEDGIKIKEYRFEDCTVAMKRASAAGGGYVVMAELSMPSESRVWQKNSATGYWSVKPLEKGVYSGDCLYFESAEDSYFINLPGAYETIDKVVVQEVRQGAGAVCCSRNDDGSFSLQVKSWCPKTKGSFTDCTIYSLTGSPVDWTRSNLVTLWEKYTADGTAKWLYDGYYRIVPEAYTPTCENGYYRCPATYLASVLEKEIKNSKAAAPLTLACFYTAMENQNNMGFFETLPTSNWLRDDFGIGGGFYDTRFNTDLILLACDIADDLGQLPLPEKVRFYADFFSDYYVKYHSWTTENGGLMVEDYASCKAAAGEKQTHTSLNHQAAEILLMYRLSEKLNDPGLSDLADRMVIAIEDTGMDWVKEDHDFHYGVSAEGEYSGKDYASLTYDDLLTLQRWIQSRKGSPSEMITSLMLEKRKWMDSKYIKDYLK